MHVLVATDETQGASESDFSWTVEGELVRVTGDVCSNPSCGCDFGWAGLASSRSTTTCRVAELEMDRDAVVGAFEQALDREGWLALFETREWIPEWVDVHLDLAAAFAVGTVLTRRGDEVFVRSGPVADQ